MIDEVTGDSLFSGTPASWVLIHQRRINKCAFLHTFLDPQVRFDILVWDALIRLDKMLKNFCVWVRKDYTSRLRGCSGVSSGMLGSLSKVPEYDSYDRRTHHDALAECRTRVHICDARMYVHLDGYSIPDKYLFQQHSCDLTSLNVGVGHEMTFRAIRAGPAKAKTLLFWSTGLG